MVGREGRKPREETECMKMRVRQRKKKGGNVETNKARREAEKGKRLRKEGREEGVRQEMTDSMKGCIAGDKGRMGGGTQRI